MNNFVNFLSEGVELSEKQVHIFLLHLDKYDDKQLYNILSDDEKQRADKLKIELKKKQFIVSRSVLRKVISKSIGQPHDDIAVYYGEHNKPFIKDKYNNKAIEFNVSHSEECVLIALTLGNKIGIDVEKVSPDIDHIALSKRFFSKNENDQLERISSDKKLDTFYRIWTRKEAFIKATGEGMTCGLDKFSVSSKREAKSKVVIEQEKNCNEEWYCFNLMDIDHYEAALSSNNEDIELIFYL